MEVAKRDSLPVHKPKTRYYMDIHCISRKSFLLVLL